MAVFWRAWIDRWPVVALAVIAPALPISFHLARPTPAPAAAHEAYPIRLELPPAQREQQGSASVASVPAIEFDLAGNAAAGDGASAVEVRKGVRLNGVEAGRATIRVGADSTLAISFDELRALLARAGRGEVATQIGLRGGKRRFVGFEQMRAQGIDVRYDVAADRIVITA